MAADHIRLSLSAPFSGPTICFSGGHSHLNAVPLFSRQPYRRYPFRKPGYNTRNLDNVEAVEASPEAHRSRAGKPETHTVPDLREFWSWGPDCNR